MNVIRRKALSDYLYDLFNENVPLMKGIKALSKAAEVTNC